MKRAAKIALATALVAAGSAASLPVAHAAFPGTNGDIAFNRLTHQQFDIWTVDADSTSTVNLTQTDRKNEDMPDWSADGTKIAFNRVTSSGRLGVWIMNADGTSPTQQTFGLQDLFPDWGLG